MPRIAKADVNAALALAAKSIITAGGTDGRTSRAEMKAALNALPKEQRALADIFFKFIDRRDFKAGAQVTAKDVNKAVAYAKEHMVAKYDLNQNGLSKDEISRMSLTGKNAVALAKALKAAGGSDVDGGGKLGSKELGTAINKLAKDANYVSESDYSPVFVTGDIAAASHLNGPNAMTAFAGPLKNLFKDDGNFPADFAGETYSPRDATSFINGLADDEDPKSSAAWKGITKLMKDNLTDLQVINIGPKDDHGGVASDQGLYGRMVLGRTSDGKVAGILIGAVET